MTTTPNPLRLLFSLAPLISGCFLFGGGAGSKTPVEALDSPEAYRDYLAANPSAEDASRHRERLAQLELIEARRQLRPVFDHEAIFSGPDGTGAATLGPDTQMIFEGEEGDRISLQVVRIAPKLEEPVQVFARGGEPAALGIARDKTGPYFSIDEPLGIPLVSTSSFDARIQQRGTYGSGGMGGGMRFCFFSPTPDACEDGYEFSYDSAHFRKYELVRKSGGQSTSLCRYQMDTTNTQHSDSITVDMSSGRGTLRDPDVEIHAHHGHLSVSFNGREICRVQDRTFTEGFFVMSDTPAISGLSIELNAGSSPVFVTADALVDIQSGGEPLELREGLRYEAYNAFVTDYNAYLALVGGGAFPESFTNSYFNLFFGKAEADAAFEEIRDSKNMDDFLAYLEAHPFNAHKNEIQKVLYGLAKEADTIEAYSKFEAQYPDSVATLDVKKRVADLEWKDTVRKPTRKYLGKYLELHPDGYHARRAELLLEGLDYAAAHKTEVDAARKLLAKARALVDKSPVTAAWDVAVIDYQNGSVYFNLNNGPVIPKGSQVSKTLYFVTHDQLEAHTATCC